MKCYLLKTIGKGVVPDYVQVRDENYTIIAYFKPTNMEKGLKELGIENQQQREIIQNKVKKADYGKIIPISIIP